jgi:ABC-type polar amino acid transport system ATPase subunit
VGVHGGHGVVVIGSSGCRGTGLYKGALNLETEKGPSVRSPFRADNGTRDKNKKDEKEKKRKGVFLIFHIFIYHEKLFHRTFHQNNFLSTETALEAVKKLVHQ